ncbi:MAG: FkbM family methyltransferase, partial [Pseudomonadota bacterium]
MDEFNLAPFFIKVDAQGMDIEIVRGGLATIAKCKPIILLKGVSYEGELRELLEPLGYRMYAYRNGRFTLQNELTWNAFFITEEKLPGARTNGST